MSAPYVIVVGVDFQPDGDLALDAALHFAANLPECDVHAVYVDKAMGTDVAVKGREIEGTSRVTTRTQNALDELETRCRDRIAALEESRPSLAFRRLITHFRLGKPADQIVQLAISVDADLVVVGTHNRKGLDRLVLGSVAERVVRIARCPVFVVRPKDHPNAEPLEPGEDAGVSPRAMFGSSKGANG